MRSANVQNAGPSSGRSDSSFPTPGFQDKLDGALQTITEGEVKQCPDCGAELDIEFANDGSAEVKFLQHRS